MPIQPHEKTEQDYREAFKAANGYDVVVGYGAGWFTIKQGGYVTKHRESKMLFMTDVLRSRAQSEEPSDG